MRTAHLIALTLAALPWPAMAQEAAAPNPAAPNTAPAAQESTSATTAVENYRRRINVVVYGNDPCPEAQSPDEIVVCARRPEEERYRLRTVEPTPGVRTEQGGVNRTLGTDDVRLAGGSGTCTTVGPNGLAGCNKGIDLLGLGAWLNSLIIGEGGQQ